MASIEIIQKLARQFNEEIKYAVIGRGSSQIEELIDLLENFEKIRPSNSGKGDNKESRSKRIEEQQWNRPESNIQQMLYDLREELLEESREEHTNERTKCYVANLTIGGIPTTALIHTGAEVTSLSEELVNKNTE